jgi:hypothetical protein
MSAHCSKSVGHFRSDIALLLTSCPPAGQGVHNWVWRATLALSDVLYPDKISDFLRVATRDCGRDCTRDIEDAVKKITGDPRNVARAKRKVQTGTGKSESNLRKIEVNDPLRRKIVEQGQTLSSLAASSPTKLPADEREIASFMLDRLFPDDPLLCVAKAVNNHVTVKKHELTKPYIYSHIVPSPMSKLSGINQKGEESQRCLANTGPRHYLVIEFDLSIGPDGNESINREFVRWAKDSGKTVHDLSAALLLHLGKAAPLVAVVDSANKSLHGWFNVQGWQDKDVLFFMGLAIRLGADPATYTKCQLVRMPGGVRRNENEGPMWLQDVIYFDESKCAKSDKVATNG